MIGIADTGFIVAFLNRRDRHHSWALSLAETVDVPLLTCQAVLAESAFHVQSCEAVFELVSDGLLTVEFDFGANFDRLRTLAVRYRDRCPDLADLCLICLSEKHRRHPVLTVDSDFHVYRRFQRERIPVIMPA